MGPSSACVVHAPDPSDEWHVERPKDQERSRHSHGPVVNIGGASVIEGAKGGRLTEEEGEVQGP
jgi:hypothetical protein